MRVHPQDHRLGRRDLRSKGDSRRSVSPQKQCVEREGGAPILIKRLGYRGPQPSTGTFTLMAGVFETESAPLSPPYLGGLLKEEQFWALAAFNEDHLVGGLTAHTLPLTRIDKHELFVYDIAVLPAYQRQGVGRRLVDELLAQARAAGICEVFVLADNEDVHALDFYRALGEHAAPVTLFAFAPKHL